MKNPWRRGILLVAGPVPRRSASDAAFHPGRAPWIWTARS